MKIDPFLWWRKAACVMGFIGIGASATHHDGIAGACAVMAIGWALCDVIAWRDYRRWKAEEERPFGDELSEADWERE